MGHTVVFSLAGLIHWSAVLHLSLLTLWTALLLTASGLYFSARFGKTTTAVIVNLGFIVLLWAATPFVSYMVEHAMTYGDTPCSDFLASGNPVVQTTVVMDTSADRYLNTDGYSGAGYTYGGTIRYRWPEGRLGFDETTGRFVLWTVWNLLLGGLFVFLAKRRLRRRVV
jgi:hypothetical protein